ncbi:DNA-binding SARP family transcriptional activator/tetratricopeptide (TPR) repeat protein [Saccharothrix tamanrassetensis]|uniref:DNA-binding SARP family transcriptional activator/tetratricopeptide (TPR) repeat protein n=1 Tax=Saccharothrix tamanrassetensis TaxID=1051531 RepID=A0A841CF98_9PSEU|nr:BTAD domain-containing putative transcriptional regulator [Saccharothrix tamanrassetensis]MBB5957222.1 DNA-binding SARP family transcriptional activator/tetratricopeptide (TPR) repeat protein [Saccharothrix tamanrassetensis]
MLRLLGEVAAYVDGRALELGPAKQRCVPAVPAVEADRVVPVDRLVERVWGTDASRRTRATLHSYLSRLRRVLAEVEGVVVVRRSGGYVLTTDPTHPRVDLHHFRALCAEAREEDGDLRAARLLAEALGLWRGQALTGVTGGWAEAERDLLERERLAAQHDLADTRLRLGQGARLVIELADRTAHHPLDERVAGQYLPALCQAGRAADALEHYRELRERLVEQLGAEPGPALRDLHRRILAADPSLTGPAAVAPVAPLAVPRQLPAPPTAFVGRREEVDRLDAALRDTATSTMAVAAIAGAGGIGKTWLALAWAHRNRHRFPGGQLFVDLRGFSPTEQPVTPETALFGFLTALGVAPDHIPPGLEARTALYRSLVADQRMLVVLDNAATPDQVEPLLPGGHGCTALITSRRTLHRLITRCGVRHLGLGTLADTEARTLLEQRLGPDRLLGEPDAVVGLLAFCQGFPLALGVLSTRAHTDPDRPLAELAAELRVHGIDALDDTDPAAGLPAVLSWSLRGLTALQRTLFALLGIAPGPDIDMPAATHLAGLSERETRGGLRALVDASLLDHRPDGRYAMHDLVRAYAVTQAHTTLPEPVRAAALDRVLYVHTALTAHHLVAPQAPEIRPEPSASDVRPQPLPDHSTAIAWLEAHHAHLLAAQHTAATRRRHDTVWHLAWTLTTLHWWRGHRHDELAVWEAALDAATHLPDPALRIRAHRRVGLAHSRLDRLDQALGHLHRGLALAEHHHDTGQQADNHIILARIREQRGDHQQALEHARRALDLRRTLDDPIAEAHTLNSVGWYTARLGDYDTARDHCQAALSLFRRHHDRAGEAYARAGLGFIAHHTGRHHEAVHHYQRTLALRGAVEDIYEITDLLDEAGHPYAVLGHHDQARATWQEALRLYREQGRDTDARRVRQRLDDLAAGGKTSTTTRERTR